MTDPDKLHEECGIFGIWLPGAEGKETEHADAETEAYTAAEADTAADVPAASVAQLIYYGLIALQHRGQESAGIVTNGELTQFNVQKGMGLVTEVFSKEKFIEPGGNIGIGHTRYSTAGGKNVVNAQPLTGHTRKGPLAVAHNGNLVNVEIMKELLEEAGSVFRTDSDSEVILNLVARSAVKKGLVEAVWDATQAIQGAYAFVVMSADSLVGARDRSGIRPMCLGRLGDGYILASESCALDAVNAAFIRDIEPGEIVQIDSNGINSFRDSEKTRTQTCSFEYIYFARPDSVVDGVTVYEMRRTSGRVLARQSPVEADFVAAVPDSGIPAAIGYSEETGIPFGIALIKNRYVGRSFIKPSQEDRLKTVQVKLNPLVGAVKGKRVILIDDSIVRGTTMRQIVERLRNAGAREVHVRIASPPVAFPCYFGIDTPYREELISSKHDEEKVREYIGADSLSFLTLEGLRESLSGRDEYCTGCFSGIYPMGAPRGKAKEAVHEV
ncbi:MAG: amidophosphoribosyltransferase [Sediminispirochaetaceae bacterium]